MAAHFIICLQNERRQRPNGADEQCASPKSGKQRKTVRLSSRPPSARQIAVCDAAGLPHHVAARRIVVPHKEK